MLYSSDCKGAVSRPIFSQSLKPSGAALLSLDPGPEIGEFDRVEESDHLNDLPFAHPHVPGAGVSVRLSVAVDGLSIEECDNHIPVGIEGSDVRDEPLLHPRVERVDHDVKEFLPAGVGSGHRCVPHNGPFGLVNEQIEWASGSPTPPIETCTDGLL